MNEATMQDHKFWTSGNDDLWIMESFCLVPSCRIKNLDTGKIMEFGVGGLTAGTFKPVEMDRGLENKLFILFNKEKHDEKRKNKRRNLKNH